MPFTASCIKCRTCLSCLHLTQARVANTVRAASIGGTSVRDGRPGNVRFSSVITAF
jgi:hypothetical protein